MKKIIPIFIVFICFCNFIDAVDEVHSIFIDKTKLNEGVILTRINLKVGKEKFIQETWIYTPEEIPDKISCVIVPPAGSDLVSGMKLSYSDRNEHLPYARKGMMVISYSVIGYGTSNSHLFKKYDSGFIPNKFALDYAIQTYPQLDKANIYIAGHSSAANLALYISSKEPRIKGCIAYAPVINVLNRFKEHSWYIKNDIDYIESISPCNLTDKIDCPVLLFYSRNDNVISTKEIDEFYDKIKSRNPNTKLFTSDKGGHYYSMIEYGINHGIEWLEEMLKK